MLPPGWDWVDNWKIDASRPTTDSEGSLYFASSNVCLGWEYAFNWNTEWYNKSSPLAMVRRRRWKRTRICRNSEETDKEDLSSSRHYIPRVYVVTNLLILL